MKEFLSLWGFGEVYGIFPGYVGKIIEPENRADIWWYDVFRNEARKQSFWFNFFPPKDGWFQYLHSGKLR